MTRNSTYILLDDWRSIEEQIKSGLNVNRGPILHTAIQQKRFSIAKKLIENGYFQPMLISITVTLLSRADINKENKRGKTPLQILIENHRQNPPRKSRRRNFRRGNHIGSGDTNSEESSTQYSV